MASTLSIGAYLAKWLVFGASFGTKGEGYVIIKGMTPDERLACLILGAIVAGCIVALVRML